MHTLECSHGAVLSLSVRGETVFAGCQDGYVKVFDLETKSFVRTIIVQEVSRLPPRAEYSFLWVEYRCSVVVRGAF